MYCFFNKNYYFSDTIEERILRVFSRGDHFNGNSKSAFDIISFAPGVELLSINIDALIPLIGEIGYFKQEVITWSIKKTNRQSEYKIFMYIDNTIKLTFLNVWKLHCYYKINYFQHLAPI